MAPEAPPLDPLLSAMALVLAVWLWISMRSIFAGVNISPMELEQHEMMRVHLKSKITPINAHPLYLAMDFLFFGSPLQNFCSRHLKMLSLL